MVKRIKKDTIITVVGLVITVCAFVGAIIAFTKMISKPANDTETTTYSKQNNKASTLHFDGKDYQMKCFGGVKFYAVNAASKEPEVAIALAQFISNEENQMKRYEMRQAIPTAVSLQDNAKIKEDPSVKAYAEQMAFTVVQSPVIPGGWWEDSKALFESIYNGEVAADDIKAKVAEHVASWKTME